jgi:hypothetical protein
VSRGSQFSVLEPGTRRVEMRTGPRYRILQRCFANAAGDAASEPWRCIGYSISATGIGITLPVQLHEGTLLSLQAWGLPRACPLQVRIVQTKQVDLVWFVGCEFIKRLADAQLEIWRSGPLDWLDDQEQ